jgi:rRNA processing protein Gar1
VEEVGEVMHVAKSGRLIVKLTSVRSNLIGNVLVDSDGRKIGKVIETIGPVSSPYASVAPLIEKTNKIIGRKVFRSAISGRTFSGLQKSEKANSTNRAFRRKKKSNKSGAS